MDACFKAVGVEKVLMTWEGEQMSFEESIETAKMFEDKESKAITTSLQTGPKMTPFVKAQRVPEVHQRALKFGVDATA